MNVLELTNETLVKKIETKDVSGFFSTKIEVPIGMKTLVFENGRNCGELQPGVYTLQSFTDKLFLTSKNQVIFSCRDTNFTLDYSTSCMTKECLRVIVNLQMEYTIDNSALFVQNLMGNRNSYSFTDFRTKTDSLIISAIQESIVQYSIKELGSPDSRQYLITSLENVVLQSLSRYGIRFKNALLFSVVHEEYDALQQKKADLWLVKEGTAISKEEREAQLAERLDKITSEEKLNDLEILEKQVQSDRQEGELAVLKRRLEQKKNLRKLVQANSFDKLATESEMQQFLFEQEKAGVLREQEKKELLQGINWAHEEKELRRQQFLKKLDLQFQHELEEYQSLWLHQTKLAALDQEMELARKVETEENRKWLAQLEKEKAERKASQDALADQLESTLKSGEIAMRQQEFESRLASIRREAEKADANANLDRQKQIDLWKEELKNRKFANHIERLQALQKLDEAEARVALDLRERETRLQSELKRDEAVCQQKFKLDVIQTLKDLDPQTAQLTIMGTISDPVMRDAIVQAIQIYGTTESAKAQAEVQNNGWKMAYDEKTNSMAQMQEMMKQMMAMQERNADRLVQMNSQSVNAMGNMNSAPVVVTPGFPPVQAGSTSQNTASEEKKVLLCPQCRAEVSPNQKFCPNCGKQL